jgi:hypothetical protein
MDDDTRRAIGLFRFGVLGPLVSARLEHGDRTAYFAAAASRRHVMPPDGRIVQLSPRTIESWFSAGPIVMRRCEAFAVGGLVVRRRRGSE